METFASKEKRQTPATSKSHHYLHHPIDPVQQVQQAAIRKILRPDEVQAKSDIGENDGKYKQETDRVADEVMRIPEPQVHSDSRKREWN